MSPLNWVINYYLAKYKEVEILNCNFKKIFHSWVTNGYKKKQYKIKQTYKSHKITCNS